MDGVGGSGRKQGQGDLDPTQKSGRLERGLENDPMDVDQGQGANKKAEHHRAESPRQTDLNKRKAEAVFSDSESSDDDEPLVNLKKKTTGKRPASVAFSKDGESSDDDAPLFQGKANVPPQKKTPRADGEHVIRIDSDTESSDDDMPLVDLTKTTGKRPASVAFSDDEGSSDDDVPLFQGRAGLPPQKKTPRADGEHVIRIDSDSESSDDDMPLFQRNDSARNKQPSQLDDLFDSDEDSDDDVPLVRRSTKGKQPAIPDSSDEDSDDDAPLIPQQPVQRVQERQKIPVPRKRKQAIEVRNELLDTPEKKKVAGSARRTAAAHRRSGKHLSRAELEAFYRSTKTGKENPDEFDIYYASYEDDLRMAREDRSVRSRQNRPDQQRPEARAQELGAENGADRTFDGKPLPLRSEIEIRFVRNNPGLLTQEKNESAWQRIIDRYVNAFNESYLALQGDSIQEAEARGIIDGSDRARKNKSAKKPTRKNLELTFGRKYSALKKEDGALDAYLDGYEKGYEDQEKTPLERARIAGKINGKITGKTGRDMNSLSDIKSRFVKKYPLLVKEDPSVVEAYLDVYEESFNAVRETDPIERAKAMAKVYARGQANKASRLPDDAELSRRFKAEYKDLGSNPEAVLIYVSECRRIFEEKEKDPIARAETRGYYGGRIHANAGYSEIPTVPKMRMLFEKHHPELVDVPGAFEAYRRSYLVGFNSSVKGPAAQAAVAGRAFGQYLTLTHSELPPDDLLKRRFLVSRPHLAGNKAALAAFMDAFKDSFASSQKEPLERSSNLGVMRAGSRIKSGAPEESDDTLEEYFIEKYPLLQETEGALESYISAYKSVFSTKLKTPIERAQALAVTSARIRSGCGKECYSEDYLRDSFVERHSDLAEDEENIRAYLDAYIGYYQEHEKTPIDRARALGHARGVTQARGGGRLPLDSVLQERFESYHETLAEDDMNIQAYIEGYRKAHAFNRRTPIVRAQALGTQYGRNYALQGFPEPSAESIAGLFEERHPSLAKDEGTVEAYVENYKKAYNRYKKPPEVQAELQGALKGRKRAERGYRLPSDEELKDNALGQFPAFKGDLENVEIFVNAYKEAFELGKLSPEGQAKVLGTNSGKIQAKQRATLPSDKKIKDGFNKWHSELAEDDALVAIYLRNYKESFKETLEYIEE